jgi:hypothetical protein
MYQYETLALEARQRQAEIRRQAENRHLAAIVQGSRRFRLIGWRLPVLNLGIFRNKTASPRRVTRRTAADNI